MHIIHIFQMRKLKLRGVKQVIRGYTVSEQFKQYLNPGSVTPELMGLTVRVLTIDLLTLRNLALQLSLVTLSDGLRFSSSN